MPHPHALCIPRGIPHFFSSAVTQTYLFIVMSLARSGNKNTSIMPPFLNLFGTKIPLVFHYFHCPWHKNASIQPSNIWLLPTAETQKCHNHGASGAQKYLVVRGISGP